MVYYCYYSSCRNILGVLFPLLNSKSCPVLLIYTGGMKEHGVGDLRDRESKKKDEIKIEREEEREKKKEGRMRYGETEQVRKKGREMEDKEER